MTEITDATLLCRQRTSGRASTWSITSTALWCFCSTATSERRGLSPSCKMQRLTTNSFLFCSSPTYRCQLPQPLPFDGLDPRTLDCYHFRWAILAFVSSFFLTLFFWFQCGGLSWPSVSVFLAHCKHFLSHHARAVVLCSGEDDTSRMHSAAGAGEREERRPAGHGSHSQLP